MKFLTKNILLFEIQTCIDRISNINVSSLFLEIYILVLEPCLFMSGKVI